MINTLNCKKISLFHLSNPNHIMLNFDELKYISLLIYLLISLKPQFQVLKLSLCTWCYLTLTLSTKVDNPISITCLMHTFIFEWLMIWCGSKNGYQKICVPKDIGLYARNMINILSSIMNIIGGPSWMTI